MNTLNCNSVFVHGAVANVCNKFYTRLCTAQVVTALIAFTFFLASVAGAQSNTSNSKAAKSQSSQSRSAKSAHASSDDAQSNTAPSNVKRQGSSAPSTRSTPPSQTTTAHIDLTTKPTLYVVNYAHLDTEWRWEYPQVIQEYLTKTMRNNFALFEKYPHYKFNFTGANRYMMMKEYFPEDFARLKQYVAAGRWFPAGSSVEESDVNSPSAESILRQVLYGNGFYRHQFGKASAEYMLPDCFGFPASLPSILAHAGIKGFSTQKLNSGWQPAARVGGPDSPEHTPPGIPFNVGIWEGTDGKTVIAALNPGSYVGQVFTDLSKDNKDKAPPSATNQGDSYVWDWPGRVNLNGQVTGVFADYHYVGTGDIGGAPNESSVKLMEAIEAKATISLPPVLQPRGPGGQPQTPPPPRAPVKVGDGPLRVFSANADQMFLDIKPGQTSRMPRYKGDLELINHSAGSITSQTYHKRWNRQNELLAGAAEAASVGALWLGGKAYPQDRLNYAWRLVMAGQFHDNMAGTSTPKSYEFIWNDDVLAMNQFAGVLTSASSTIASALDTQAQGTALVIYNPLNIAREDLVEATVSFPNGVPQSVRVTGPDGKEAPAQVIGSGNGAAKVLFVAKVPSVGYAVYDVQPADGPASTQNSELSVSESSLGNARYRIKINDNGDVSSIFDNKSNHELLSAPIRLAIITDNPAHWPAWNMDFEDEQRAPRAMVGGPAKVRVVENGPVRVAVEVSREAEGSKFVQTVRLGAGDAGNRVEFGNVIEWNTKEGNLKAVFALSTSNKNATYNWDIGTIERPNEDERQFEVASHQWIDLSDQGGAYGATILTDSKYASDKPNDNTLRLTLVRTPGTRGGYSDQGSMDLGHHEFVFGLSGHAGDRRQEETDWQAWRLNQPLIAFESPKHSGRLGKSFSLLKLNNSRVRLLALKKAEENDDVIVRLVEISGKAQPNVHVSFAGPVSGAREVNGQEQPIGPATVTNGELVTSLTPFQPRSFALKLGAAPAKGTALQSQPVTLPYDASVATRLGRPAEGCFDCSLDSPTAPQGKALPAEMLPADINFNGIRFHLAPSNAGKPNAVIARGQTITLPAGKFDRLYILAASASGDQKGTFRIGDQPIELTIQDWTGYIGQWDKRIWKQVEEPLPPEPAAGDNSPAAQRATRIRAYVKDHGPMMRSEFANIITPGFIKRADVAWFASHRHAADGSNEAYAYSYLFAYPVDVPPNAHTLTLPDNLRIRILAISGVNDGGQIRPAGPLYDTLERSAR